LHHIHCRYRHRNLYLPPPTSNRLSGINLAAGGTRAYTYDGAGNVLTDSRGAGYAYTYDAAGRMASMSINGIRRGNAPLEPFLILLIAGHLQIRLRRAAGHPHYDLACNHDPFGV
jgi:YD repeat-containing protein